MPSVSRETKLAHYVSLLQRWGSTLNLTSSGRRTDAALRGFIDDCLCIVPELPRRLERLVDLGSGQGFPAIPLAIATDAAIEMIEADRRKAAFLTIALAELDLNGVVHRGRIEATAIAPAACVTARALAPTADLIRLALPFLALGGVGLFLKGPAAADEVQTLNITPGVAVELLPTSRPPSTLVKVTRLG